MYELMAKIGLDSKEFDDGLNEAGGKMKGLGGTAGKVVSTVAKAGAAAVVAAGTAAVAVGKQAVEAYADFEQLSGGIQTLYGENSTAAETMMQNANNAWKTAGMSANEYMETAISSSAALISSLGGDTDRAAELMDQAIVDMSDNVNKMGTSMESVQNAYRGFSRGNFTMLDNLALGFAGTKEGMQELLDKAEELSGVKFDIDSYADIVEAIHVVQTEMGITGTTALEASETISGSTASVKTAWANLVTGLADENADLDQLVNNFVESVSTAAGNVLPKVEQALIGIGKVVEGLAPVIAEALPTLISDVLPQILKSAASLVKSIGEALIKNLPMLFDVGIDLLFGLIDGFVDALPELIPAVVQVILIIVDKLTEPNTLMKLIEAAVQIIEAIAQGLLNAIPDLVKAVPEIMLNLLEAILRFIPQLVASGAELMINLALGIVEGGMKVIEGVVELLGELKDKFMERVEDAKEWGRDLIGNFVGGIKEKLGSLWDTVKSIGSGIKNLLGFSEPKEGPLSNFHTYAPDMMALFAKGIKDNEHLVRDQIASSFDFGNAFPNAGTGATGTGAATTQGNIYNITVNGIEQLDEIIRWYESRQVIARMA